MNYKTFINKEKIIIIALIVIILILGTGCAYCYLETNRLSEALEASKCEHARLIKMLGEKNIFSFLSNWLWSDVPEHNQMVIKRAGAFVFVITVIITIWNCSNFPTPPGGGGGFLDNLANGIVGIEPSAPYTANILTETFNQLLLEGQQINIHDAAQAADAFIQLASIN